ncbi:hypothetical protein J2Z83_003932 [Virgibacillus natechei]|uniref:Uncharacterized protein n=1 Tax=Virgibacillus natechei TaxID=1216297 RepID=A0ABS4ILC6_9BACI|nr:hypothetical protein [Virgibacillus natechei]MBP1971777.1 hypothetical protein [Virgibacillus natechei]UZD12893.1 hypothetical protein OLD84_18740 [Virgibacillus natechei]
MGNNERNKKHFKNVQNETDNPAILKDVMSTDLEQYKDEKRERNHSLHPIQEVARDNIDGKTWQNLDE